MRRTFAVLAIVVPLLASFLCSCGGREENPLPALEPTPVLGAGPGWLVVEQAYVRVKSSPGFDSGDVAFLRAGDVVEVVGRERGDAERSDAGIWYRVRSLAVEGWVHGSFASLYAHREQAERAAGEFR
ncbi:MAG TPA: SH3 domain-containing protein [Spirochaetales bacterium]|nr:SH3 domain-containing protein [Spirochaetales bacterium]